MCLFFTLFDFSNFEKMPKKKKTHNVNNLWTRSIIDGDVKLEDKYIYLSAQILLKTLCAVHKCCEIDSEYLQLIEVKSKRQGHIRFSRGATK